MERNATKKKEEDAKEDTARRALFQERQEHANLLEVKLVDWTALLCQVVWLEKQEGLLAMEVKQQLIDHGLHLTEANRSALCP